MGERAYQTAMIDEARLKVAEFGSTVIVAPTGSGKTVVAGGITRRGVAKGSYILLLVHRTELVDQSIDTLAEACPDVSVGVVAAGWPSKPWAPLQVAMVQSLTRRKNPLLRDPDIIIVDEAHHAPATTWAKILERWPNARRIGLTATPERLDGKGLVSHFESMVLGPTVKWLSTTINPDTGITYLAPTRTLTVPVGLDLEGLRRNRRGEYREDEIAERVTTKVVAGAANAYQRHAAGRSAIFFGINRDHSRRVCAELRSRGVRAEHVDGDDHRARRKEIMRRFRDGDLTVVGNCDLISEGFDAPACEAVIMGAHTNSITRYLQMAGRAMRPAPGKTALVLDLAKNAHGLGLPDEPREWSLEDGEIVPKRSKERHPRACERCFTTFYGRRCPACQHETPPMVDVEEVDVELVEAKARGVPTRSRAQNMNEVRRAFRHDDPLAELRRVAKRLGYKPGWANVMYDLGQQYGFGNR